MEMLDDFVKVGIINKKNVEKLADGHHLKDAFYSKQKEFIIESLNNCSKTAWLLQEYLAQTLHRSLKKSGKHSDISSKAYTKATLAFQFRASYVPSAILKQFSWMQTNGLFEWWPNFINRTGLIVGGEHILPPTPNMSGKILVIFVLLGGGLSVAITCFVFEMWGKFILHIVFVYKFCVSKLYILILRNASFSERLYGNVVILVKSGHE